MGNGSIASTKYVGEYVFLGDENVSCDNQQLFIQIYLFDEQASSKEKLILILFI